MQRIPGKQYPNGRPPTPQEQEQVRERIEELSKQMGERVQEYREKGTYEPRKLWR